MDTVSEQSSGFQCNFSLQNNLFKQFILYLLFYFSTSVAFEAIETSVLFIFQYMQDYLSTYAHQKLLENFKLYPRGTSRRSHGHYLSGLNI